MLSVIIAATLIAATAAQTCDYSSICPDHTMCLYPTTDYGPDCLTPVRSGVDVKYQQEIVRMHNWLRERTARGEPYEGTKLPPAANMRKMEWDDELARIAQRWANQCILCHDTCRNVDRFYVGQNTYSHDALDTYPYWDQYWSIALKTWYIEVLNFSNSNIDPFRFNSATRRYTQVVWADTYLVGCGFAGFSDNGTWHKSLYVCNYGPGGNIIGGSMYKKGPACSQCPAGTICDNNLCA